MTPDELADPNIDRNLPRIAVPTIDVDDPAACGLAIAVEDPETFAVPLVAWPVAGGRPLDQGTGVGGGSVEGRFACVWDAGRLVATNDAVAGRYVIGLGDEGRQDRVLLWHVNQHPDGGQLFWSPDGAPFIVPAAPPGEPFDPNSVRALRSDGSVGICLLPGVWHDGVYPIDGDGAFRTRQGAVHARVSIDVAAELAVLLDVTLR